MNDAWIEDRSNSASCFSTATPDSGESGTSARAIASMTSLRAVGSVTTDASSSASSCRPERTSPAADLHQRVRPVEAGIGEQLIEGLIDEVGGVRLLALVVENAGNPRDHIGPSAPGLDVRGEPLRGVPLIRLGEACGDVAESAKGRASAMAPHSESNSGESRPQPAVC